MEVTANDLKHVPGTETSIGTNENDWNVRITHYMNSEHTHIKTEHLELELGLVSESEVAVLDNDFKTSGHLPLQDLRRSTDNSESGNEYHGLSFTFEVIPSTSSPILKLEPEDSPTTVSAESVNELDPLALEDDNDSDEQKWSCDTCNESFTYPILERHVREGSCDHQNTVLQENADLEATTAATIETNSTTSSSKRALLVLDRADIERSSGVENENSYIKCPYCSKLFHYRKQLLLHLPTHFRNTLSPCPICEVNFVTTPVLLQHIATHNEEDLENDQVERLAYFREKFGIVCTPPELEEETPCKPVPEPEQKFTYYACSVCAKKFERRGPMLQHYHASHVWNHECSICNVKFETAAELESHKLFHSSPKLFQCTVCQLEFSFETNLTHHIRKSHPLTPTPPLSTARKRKAKGRAPRWCTWD